MQIDYAIPFVIALTIGTSVLISNISTKYTLLYVDTKTYLEIGLLVKKEVFLFKYKIYSSVFTAFMLEKFLRYVWFTHPKKTGESPKELSPDLTAVLNILYKDYILALSKGKVQYEEITL